MALPPQKFGESQVAGNTTQTTGPGTSSPVANVAGRVSSKPVVVKSRPALPGVSTAVARTPAQMARAISTMNNSNSANLRALRNTHDYGAKVVTECTFPAIVVTQGNISNIRIAPPGVTINGYRMESVNVASGFSVHGSITKGFNGSITVQATWVLPSVAVTVSPGTCDIIYW